MRVISFYAKHGLVATKEAYRVGRSSIFAWRKNYQKSRGNLLSLLPSSTKPKTTRRMIINPQIVEFIHNLRENNVRMGKVKLKILVDAYCRQENLSFISSSSIGRVIKRNNWFYHRIGKIYHNPNSGFTRLKTKRHKNRIASKFKTDLPGELLQLDTVVRFDLSKFVNEIHHLGYN